MKNNYPNVNKFAVIVFTMINKAMEQKHDPISAAVAVFLEISSIIDINKNLRDEINELYDELDFDELEKISLSAKSEVLKKIDEIKKEREKEK